LRYNKSLNILNMKLIYFFLYLHRISVKNANIFTDWYAFCGKFRNYWMIFFIYYKCADLQVVVYLTLVLFGIGTCNIDWYFNKLNQSIQFWRLNIPPANQVYFMVSEVGWRWWNWNLKSKEMFPKTLSGDDATRKCSMIENRWVCQNSLWVNQFSLSYVDLSLNGREYWRNRRHINPVPPINTNEAIGSEQINGSDPLHEDETMQTSPAVPSTSVVAKNTPTILIKLQPKYEQTQSHASNPVRSPSQSNPKRRVTFHQPQLSLKAEPMIVEPTRVTRSGRQVRRPARYDDYQEHDWMDR
jgi:hypothetical protein